MTTPSQAAIPPLAMQTAWERLVAALPDEPADGTGVTLQVRPRRLVPVLWQQMGWRVRHYHRIVDTVPGASHAWLVTGPDGQHGYGWIQDAHPDRETTGTNRRLEWGDLSANRRREVLCQYLGFDVLVVADLAGVLTHLDRLAEEDPFLGYQSMALGLLSRFRRDPGLMTLLALGGFGDSLAKEWGYRLAAEASRL